MGLFGSKRQNDDVSPSPSSSLIQGIDNDTLFFIFFISAIVGLWIYYSRRNRSTTIHPDNRQDVELLRQRSHDHGDSGNSSSSHDRSHDDPCPICLNDSTILTVQTNCGHKFCGNCIISYWKFQSNWMSGLTCPVCRQQVTVLLTRFTNSERATSDNNDHQTVATSVKDFNRRFSNAPRTWQEYFHDIPVLVPYLLRQLFTNEGLAWTYRLRTIFIVISVILYVISPLDILPESLLGIFGLVDDVFVLLGSALYFVIAFRQTLAQ